MENYYPKINLVYFNLLFIVLFTCLQMGLHFYLKSLLTVSVVVVLVWITWYKTTEVVREIVDFQTKLAHDKRNHLKGSQINANPDEKLVEEMEKEERLRSDKTSTKPTTEVEKGSITVTPTGAEQEEDLTTDVEADKVVSTTTTYTMDSPTRMTSKSDTTTSLPTKTTTSSKALVTITNIRKLEKQSTEKRHVAFLKVHKTGSSTVQNIFLRFGDSRNLTFILPHDKRDLAETKYPNMISYSNTLTDHNIVPPPEGRHFEILCCHVIYNRTQFQKYLPEDTAYIGLVREPVTRLESSFRYFNLYPNVNLSDFAAAPLQYDKGLHSMSNNRMSFEFGFPLSLFPNSKEKPENLQAAIDQYVDKLMDEFDLIMINEKMDESLVLMKRVLNWHVKDIMYMKQLVAKQETRRFSEKDIKNLKSYLYLDYALYQAAVTKFDTKVEKLGEDFKEEVDNFRKEKEQIYNFCRNKNTGILSFPRSKWDSAYNITAHDCSLYTKFEIKFVQDIRMKQYGKIGI